jgi:hypothetical protein
MTRTFFTAHVFDGAVHIGGVTGRPCAVVYALRSGRYVNASSEWKGALTDLLAAGAPVCWPARRFPGVDFDFGEELPVTGPALPTVGAR